MEKIPYIPLFLALCCIDLCLSFESSSSLHVIAPAGTFQGKETVAPNGQAYMSFQGIPYAKPPIGDLRFAKPQPKEKLGEF